MSAAPSILDECLELSPSVSLRPEPFGALAYHVGNRRLTFLKRPELVTLIESLDGVTQVRALLVEASIPEEQWSAYARVLETMSEAEMVRCRRVVSG
jgi:putative mycofactocin binding protein MftB